MTDVTVVIVSYNTQGLLKSCVEKLDLASQSLTVNRIFIDNASTDDSIDLIKREFKGDQLIVNSVNIGFGRANNQALSLVDSRYVLLLNTDAFVSSDALTKTVAFMDENPRCGILGVRLEGSDGNLQPCCRYFPTPWNTFVVSTGLTRVFSSVRLTDDMTWGHDAVRFCDWVVGCFYLVRRELIDQIGLFDPRFFLYFEEVDHCFAAKKAGWDVVFYPYTTVIHIGGESAKSVGDVNKVGRQIVSMQVESELLYFRKNHGLLGVWSSFILSILSEFINLLKSVIKMRSFINFSIHFRKVGLVCRLFVKTRMGSVPTR